MAYKKRVRIKLSLTVVIVYQQIVCNEAHWPVALARVSLFSLQVCHCVLDIESERFSEDELKMMDYAWDALILLDHFLMMGLDLNWIPCPNWFRQPFKDLAASPGALTPHIRDIIFEKQDIFFLLKYSPFVLLRYPFPCFPVSLITRCVLDNFITFMIIYAKF